MFMDEFNTFDMSCVRLLPSSLSDVTFDVSDKVVAIGDQIKLGNIFCGFLWVLSNFSDFSMSICCISYL